MDNMIVEYNVTDAAIAELKSKYADPKPVENGAGLKLLRADIAVVRTLRTSVEHKRKELKADALAWGRKVDTEAKRITAEMLSMERPLKEREAEYEAKVQAEKEEKARIERERVEAIHSRIRHIELLPTQHIGSTASNIACAKDDLQQVDYFDYQEFGNKKLEAIEMARNQLQAMFTDANKKEMAERKAAEAKRLAEIEREELEVERKRLERIGVEYHLERERQDAIERLEREELAAARVRLEEEDERRRQEAERMAEAARCENERQAAIEREELAEERRKLEEDKLQAQAIKDAETDAAIAELKSSWKKIREQKASKDNWTKQPDTMLKLKAIDAVIDEETITIPLEEYKALLRTRDILAALENAGVDNWDGYDEALEALDD